MRAFRKFFESNLGWALIAGIAVGAAGTLGFLQTRIPAQADNSATSALSGDELQLLAALDSASAKLVEQVLPSVAFIRTQFGEGSGVVYRPDGYIITNSHVVGRAKTVTVLLGDGREVEGKVIADNEDPLADVAVVKVDVKDLPAAKFGDSFDVRPGQIAIAIGAPFGLPESVSFGHISANGRTAQVVIGGKAYLNMIQTDAAINPGNSGGPLLNYRGEVVGINTIINTTTGSNAGVGFAIPSNTVRLVADQLIATGKVVRGYIGVTPENMKPFEMKQLGIRQGAIVRSVDEKGPAAKAGIKVGDVITEIAGQKIRGEQDLRDAMLLHKPGETVQVKFLRNGQSSAVSVQLAERPNPNDLVEQPMVPQPNRDEMQPRRRGEEAQPVTLGVTVRDLTTEERAEYGSGVLVTGVEPGSPAAQAGLFEGAVIQRIGSVRITSVDQLKSAVSRFRTGDQTTITYRYDRNGVTATVTQTIQF